MNLKSKLQNYDITRPLKDNLTQVKNSVEAIVSILIARHITGIQSLLINFFGDEVALEILALAGVVEALVVYWVISFIEYLITDNGDR